MKSEFVLAFNQICSDRGLSSEVVLEALEMALVSAYRRDTNSSATQNVSAKIDPETGQARVYVEKQVVEAITDPELEISLAKARALKPDAEVGGVVMVENTPRNFGRIAAQNAKQIILQRIREAEREARYDHYIEQEGEIIHGTVQSIKPHAVTLSIEGTEAVLPRREQVPGERYTLHQRLRAYVLEVRKTGRGPQITVSRSHKNMLRRLLELEVPEIFNGAVEIKAIAREAGSRSKVAVAARQPGVDPVGACVGMRGVRIQSIVNELGGEKIDVIEWNPAPATFIAKALSPAKVLSVQLEDTPGEGKTAKVVVPDDQLSLAIGRAGQNARLAAKMTSWRIDIQGVTEAATWALQQVNEDPNVLPALGLVAESLPSVAGALRRHEKEKMPYSSEELLAMRQIIEGVGNYYASLRHAERARLLEEEAARRAAIESAQAERRAVIEAARARIPSEVFDIPLAETDLSTRVLGHLERAGLENVGQVLERLAEGDEGLLKLEGIGPKSLGEIKQYIETLALPEPEEAAPAEAVAETEAKAAAEVEVEVEAAEVEIEAAEAVEEAAQVAPPPEIAPETPVEAVEEAAAVEMEVQAEEALPEAVQPEAEMEAKAPEVAEEEAVEVTVIAEAAPEPTGDEVAAPEAEGATEVVVAAEKPLPPVAEETVAAPEVVPEPVEEESAPVQVGVSQEAAYVFEAIETTPEEEEGEDDKDQEERERKRERRLRRRLVFDEAAGEVVARRQRKRGRVEEEWDEYLE
jgi:N utilization substance protein A